MCSNGRTLVEQVLAEAGGVDEEILALVGLAEQVEAALVERVGAFDAAEGWKDDGAYSFASWLRARADISRADAASMARLARSLRAMPATEEAVKAGKLSVAKAGLLAAVVNDRTKERFTKHESFLIDQVQGLDVDNAKVVLDQWKRMADTDGPDPSDPARNRASLTTGWGGRWHLDADLDPVAGAKLKAALDATVEMMHHSGRFADLGPDATASRRGAEGLVEMAERSTGRTPDQGAVHAKIIVIVPWERLLERQADPLAPPPELIGTGPVAIDDVLRLSLTSTVSSLLLDKDGRPLNLGREVRLATDGQWIALKVRDGGCVAPGCDRPASWCSAHHLTYWTQGGRTDLANLCLLCSHHHHLIHDQGWTLHHAAGGSWHLTRPDSTPVDPPRYPNHHKRPQGPSG